MAEFGDCGELDGFEGRQQSWLPLYFSCLLYATVDKSVFEGILIFFIADNSAQ
jgi:hypothetical protein